MIGAVLAITVWLVFCGAITVAGAMVLVEDDWKR